MKRALGACALVLALAVSFMAPASAAQLVLTGGQHPSSFAGARCGDAVAATNPATAGTTNAVQLSGIDVACGGLPVAVQLYDSLTATTVTGTATAPAAGGAVVVAMTGQYTPTASTVISVTVATWPIPTTWTYTAATLTTGCVVVNPGGNVVNGKSCSLTFGGNTDGSGTAWNVKITVSTSETNPVAWRATVDFADLAKFPFLARYVGEYTGGAAYAPLPGGFCSGSTRLVTFTGVAGRGTDQVVAGSSKTFDFVGNSTGQITNPVYSCP
ncbi:MAG TPA: hypothetical protein VFW79_05455 [Cellulomonas sp.]|uniref:hypothetical protein n=1 Tax=Cellulomonas sp. TaxID=40001 RepID=UPI002E35EE2C|nr:hypothetical protein [Cellulomonas sp.]HEX5332072.1 hypothetical protein [Cellulomonas sp.]